ARAIDALLWRTIAQLRCRRQVAISPRGGLGHITHLIVGASQQVLGALMVGLAENNMVQQLGCPSVVALVERRLSRSDGLVRAADEIQVTPGGFLRRQ